MRNTFAILVLDSLRRFRSRHPERVPCPLQYRDLDGRIQRQSGLSEPIPADVGDTAVL